MRNESDLAWSNDEPYTWQQIDNFHRLYINENYRLIIEILNDDTTRYKIRIITNIAPGSQRIKDVHIYSDPKTLDVIKYEAIQLWNDFIDEVAKLRIR